jgi:hypothetical protein
MKSIQMYSFCRHLEAAGGCLQRPRLDASARSPESVPTDNFDSTRWANGPITSYLHISVNEKSVCRTLCRRHSCWCMGRH